MATIGPTGVGIPDVGDPDAASSQLVIDNIEDYQSHQHRGPAFNEPPKIGGSSWLGDATMDQNGEGITNLIYTSFTDPAAEAIPNRSIYYDDGVGFVFKTEGGAEATLVTSAGSIPTTNGEGFIGLGPPARATYTAGISRFAFYDDFGASNLGDLFAAQVKATNNATDCFAQLTSDGTSGMLELTEDSADFSCFLKLATGWNAAATVNTEINIPTPTVLDDISGGSGIISAALESAVLGQGSWTPTVAAGVVTLTYGTQAGSWMRIGNLLIVNFTISWTLGATFSDLFIGDMPFAQSTAWRGITGATTPACGVVRNASNVMYFLRGNSSTALAMFDSAGTPIQGSAAATYSGTAAFFVA